jgi:hypothetical protein
MKQNITVEQLNELSEKGKEELDKWCIKNGHITQEEKELFREISPNKPSGLLLLSIGQMIEFLDVNDFYCLNISRQIKKDNKKMKKPQWGVFDIGTYFSDNITTNGFIKLELCDALWEAVKEFLEK